MMNTQSEHDWEAECDARTLAEAEVIKADVTRHERAQKAAERLAQEAAEKTKALKRISDPKEFYKGIAKIAWQKP